MKFSRLAEYFADLEKTASRLKMVEILAGLFEEAEKAEVDKIIYLSQERLVPAFVKLEFGISEKLTTKVLAKATHLSEHEINNLFKKIGDHGSVAEEIIKGKGQGLSVREVYEDLYKIAETSGEDSVAKKTDLLSELIKKLSPQEIKYVLRIPIGKLRLGIGDPTVMDALSFAYAGDKSLRKLLERAYNLCSDLGLVGKTLFAKGKLGIEKFKVQVGDPIRMALAERLSSPEEIIEKIGTCSVEPKYDGFRCQVHKDGHKVKIFSRNLEDNSAMFPDIVEGCLKQIKDHCVILEGEALSYNPDTGEYLPFQVTVQRKRKYGIEEMRKKFPLALFCFDLLYCQGKDYTPEPYAERRKRLTAIIREGEVLQVSPAQIVKTGKDLSKFFEEAVAEGLEGLMAKRLEAPYQAGARNFNWVKLKRSYAGKLSDTVDVVLIGYLKGKGARAKFGIGSLFGAVYDKKTDRFKSVAKIGSGLSEEEWLKMKKMLDKITVKEKPSRVDCELKPDVWVEPKYVVEVMADEVTKSPVHAAGYALRFPRLVSFVRSDRTPEDATTVNEILKMYAQQIRAKV